MNRTLHHPFPALLAISLLFTQACMEIDEPNEPPEAVAEVENMLADGGFIEVDDTVTVQLVGDNSSDDDGRIVEHQWRRTDNSPDGGVLDDTYEPEDVPNPELDLPPGFYRFTLWVIDDEGAVSIPASVEVQVGPPPEEEEGPEFEPDMACVDAYPDPDEACTSCVCAPMVMGGCLEHYQNCFENEDEAFASLCTELVMCGVENDCFGADCLGPCEAEVNAAATYDGGEGLRECSSGDPMANPCAAVSQLLSPCTNETSCVDLCQGD